MLADVALCLGDGAVAAQPLAERLVFDLFDRKRQRHFLLGAAPGTQPVRLCRLAPLGGGADGVARLEQQVKVVEVVLVLES